MIVKRDRSIVTINPKTRSITMAIVTTDAIGEEDPTTTRLIGEEGPGTTRLAGEEGDTTHAIGEEDPGDLNNTVADNPFGSF
jgi:hypothetical protein